MSALNFIRQFILKIICMYVCMFMHFLLYLKLSGVRRPLSTQLAVRIDALALSTIELYCTCGTHV